MNTRTTVNFKILHWVLPLLGAIYFGYGWTQGTLPWIMTKHQHFARPYEGTFVLIFALIFLGGSIYYFFQWIMWSMCFDMTGKSVVTNEEFKAWKESSNPGFGAAISRIGRGRSANSTHSAAYGRNKGAVEPDVKVFITCPSCKQTLRVPVGKGRIQVTCPKCKTVFISNT